MLFFPEERLGGLFGEPIYSPPYDSPIEDIFAYHVVKYLAPDAKLHPQHPVQTSAGHFFLDFLVERGLHRIGIECDGAAYHDANRDCWRDALILGTGQVGAVYRFSGRILTYHVNDCFTLMSRWDPYLFSERGLLNLETLTSDEVHSADIECEESLAFIRYADLTNERVFDEIVVRRSLDRHGQRWRALIDRASLYPGKALEEIIVAESRRQEA